MTRMGRRTQTGGVCPAAPGRRPSDWRDTDVVFLDVEGDRHDEGEWYCDENAAVDPSPPPRGLVERRAQVAVAVAVVLTAVTLFVGLAGSGRADPGSLFTAIQMAIDMARHAAQAVTHSAGGSRTGAHAAS